MKHLKTIKPDLPHVFLRKKDFSEISERGGDLTQLLNLADSIQEKQIKPNQWQENCFKNTSLQGEINNTTLNQNRFTTVCEPQKYRLLMFRDSFSLALMPYLSESFSLVDYVPQSPVRIKNMQDIVQRQLPDIVIEQRTSRWLRTPEGWWWTNQKGRLRKIIRQIRQIVRSGWYMPQSLSRQYTRWVLLFF